MQFSIIFRRLHFTPKDIYLNTRVLHYAHRIRKREYNVTSTEEIKFLLQTYSRNFFPRAWIKEYFFGCNA